MTAYDELLAFTRTSEALGQVAGRLGWDQEAMMPEGAADQRAEEMAAMEGVLHARRTDPRLGEWLAKAEAPDAAGQAILRHVARSYARHTRVPARLAEELARVTSRAQGIWAEARARNEVGHFLPWLERVVALKREEAAALAEGGDLYDALIQDYEPGANAASLGAMFDSMRPRLVALRERAIEAHRDMAPLKGHFPEGQQMALARELAARFGYDFAHGRIDLVTHPFQSGSGADVRVTTRVDESDPFNCLYSTIHEIGHAGYEQGIDPAYRLTPLGQGVSMGVHESQSRLYENQLGRSRAFTEWLFGELGSRFGDLGVADAESFYRTVNRVAPGYIRTESDELQYNLHIMLRFDLERALVNGDLAVTDLEAAWNSRFLADFGFAVDKPSNGVLQDVHWSVGLFGYFPTYSLGNLYAGCLFKSLKADLPNLNEDLRQGNPLPATLWLREKLQVFGGLREPVETITHASGAAPSAEPLLGYLEAKFGEIL